MSPLEFKRLLRRKFGGVLSLEGPTKRGYWEIWSKSPRTGFRERVRVLRGADGEPRDPQDWDADGLVCEEVTRASAAASLRRYDEVEKATEAANDRIRTEKIMSPSGPIMETIKQKRVFAGLK